MTELLSKNAVYAGELAQMLAKLPNQNDHVHYWHGGPSKRGIVSIDLDGTVTSEHAPVTTTVADVTTMLTCIPSHEIPLIWIDGCARYIYGVVQDVDGTYLKVAR